MTTLLDFEKPLVELENRINELKGFARDKGMALDEEIALLENRLQLLKQQIYRELTPWQRAQLARHPERPNSLDLIRLICTDFLPLAGDRTLGDDPALVGGIARFDGEPVTVIGHLRGHNTKENLAVNFGMPHPEGFRKALRLVRQAEKFHRPVLSLVDTKGADSGAGAEERGQAWAIAENLAAFSQLRTPVIVVIIGEGGSGGALAIGVGDALLMLENSIFSVISPEGCAAILWKDASRASEAAGVLKITAEDLMQLGIIDDIIPEPLGGAHRDPVATAENIKKAIRRSLEMLRPLGVEELLERRYERLCRIGALGGGKNNP